MSHPYNYLFYSSKFIATVNDDKSLVAIAFEFCPSIQILTVKQTVSIVSDSKAPSEIETCSLSTFPAYIAVSVDTI